MDAEPGGKRAGVDPRWYAGALAVTYIFYWIFWYLNREWAFNQPYDPVIWAQVARRTNATLACILVATVIMLRSRRIERLGSRLRQWLLMGVVLVFAGIDGQIWNLDRREAWMFMEDVGRTTIVADHLLIRGVNPYAAQVDESAERRVHRTGLNGYKYLPLMMAAYLPFDRLCAKGDQAILIGNLVFTAGGILLLGFCVRHWISLDAALLSAALFLMPEIIYHVQFGHGGNDIVPMLPLMAAIYFVDRRWICGLLVGLGISFKLLPGVLWIPICLTPFQRGRYLLGLAAGLLPCLPFFLWNPTAFINSIFVFTALRPVEDNSVLFSLPPVLRPVAGLILAVIFFSIARHTARNQVGPIARCGLAAVLGLSVLLLSSANHPNYFVWWLMPLCVMIAATVFNPAIYEWIK